MHPVLAALVSIVLALVVAFYYINIYIDKTFNSYIGRTQVERPLFILSLSIGWSSTLVLFNRFLAVSGVPL